MIKSQRVGWVLFLSAVCIRLVFHLYSGFITDDAFITFRYAENIANGIGFVFNPGERVLGTSTPLFTLLLSLCALLRVGLPLASVSVSLIAAGLTAILVYRLTIEYGLTRLAWLPPLIYILWPRSIAAETCGMETALFTLLVTGTFFLYRLKRYDFALILASLALLCRPEGAIVMAIITVAVIFRGGKAAIPKFILPLLLLASWSLFSLGYFGALVPNSIPAKLALYSETGSGSSLEHAAYLFALHSPFGWISTLLAMAGVILLAVRRRLPVPEILLVLIMLLFLTFSHTHLFFWYVVPIYPIYSILVAVPLLTFLDALPHFQRHKRLAALAVGIVIAIPLIAATVSTAESYRSEQDVLERVHKRIGLYLAENVKHGGLVAAEDIGYIGFYSGATILDRDGLVSPEAIPYNISGRYIQLIEDARPEWLVAAANSRLSGFLKDPWLIDNYQRVRRYSYSNVEYVIYQKL